MEYVISDEPLQRKLMILADAAKYDVACTSSGVSRSSGGTGLGNSRACGICHSFASDGRCISLLKILLTNDCIYDCKYCKNRVSNDVPRATFTPEEICRLTIGFYRRNYIEGLFLSSGVIKNPHYTMELILETVRLLREKYDFKGYIHVKSIPGADEDLILRTGYYADRMSCNLELPTAEGLKKLAPNKTRQLILQPLRQVQKGILQNKEELTIYRHTPKFVPAGQSTQVIVGATPESDYEIISVAEAMYKKFSLRRVFYSAYIAVNKDELLPAVDTKPPLLREHRLYQADWLMRFYGFRADELLSEQHASFNIALDPKCDWALRHLDQFPVEINKASYEMILRVPGIGVTGARRICRARRYAILDFNDLKRMGIVLKRAMYFITCSGRMMYRIKFNEDAITKNLLAVDEKLPVEVRESISGYHQLSMFDDNQEGRWQIPLDPIREVIV
ncbi:MAG: putative DNA modification/repair radical SAM protein [Frisingicoccus sp.]|uniref:putative DNA modification/repair radical SAM protein n=1 Tax=Frisingicoccus sp. TaxID=1918627 RepID=UPI002A834F7E|nr:putative DNA modification/repair radical SAM protein [Frisingicoccus sp.]MDY4835188.1 putative DNA modification/repair radical SAM protein [Frisingicoccus sp.]